MSSELLAPGLRIGLLGGSFNPAHDGHRHISLVALRRLGLNQVWWLVSPQNPLKPSHGMAPLEKRFESAERAAGGHPAIHVSDIEARMGTRYTADTIRKLTDRAPFTRFVWIMGADNFVQFPHWRRWTEIMENVPVAVVARPGYGLKARLGNAAQRYAGRQVAPAHAPILPDIAPPAWVFLEERLHPASSTEIRNSDPRAWHER